MTEEELQQAILGLIMKIYKSAFAERITVIKEEGNYTLKLPIVSYLCPTFISYACDTDQEFLDFIEKELKRRNYMKTRFYGWTKEPARTEN
jgi:hypothetical protein